MVNESQTQKRLHFRLFSAGANRSISGIVKNCLVFSEQLQALVATSKRRVIYFTLSYFFQYPQNISRYNLSIRNPNQDILIGRKILHHSFVCKIFRCMQAYQLPQKLATY